MIYQKGLIKFKYDAYTEARGEPSLLNIFFDSRIIRSRRNQAIVKKYFLKVFFAHLNKAFLLS